jgi:hypothetical protein
MRLRIPSFVPVLLALVFLGSLPQQGSASFISVPLHVADGTFGDQEWTASSTNGSPARPSVSVQSFTVAGNPQGAYLFAEQTLNGNPTSGPGNQLHLMYDFVASPTVLGALAGASNSFFDVFFQVPTTNTDYVVHLTANGFQAYEKPTGTASALNADGSLALTGSPWSLLDGNVLSLAQFQGAIGFGASPNSSQPHLQAEFALSIDSGNRDGLYGSDAAFLSVSAFSDIAQDPPISSGIFTLNPDGTTTILPALGPDGGPVQQPQDVVTTAAVPEPHSVVLLGLGAVGLVFGRRKQRIS